MDPQDLKKVESVCESLLRPDSHEARQQAEQLLNAYATNADNYTAAKALIQNSASPYAQHLAATGLSRLITEKGAPSQTKTELRNAVLNALASRGADMQNFVVTSFSQLLARCTKLGWWEDEVHKSIVDDTTSFLKQPSNEHYNIGLRILTELVADMNVSASGSPLIQQRKTSSSFRDSLLIKIFETSLKAIQQLHENKGESVLMQNALALAKHCLMFDFVGTASDDSAEDLGTIQFPSAWRKHIEDESVLKLLFSVYSTTTPPASVTCLECLLKLASARRSIFQTESGRHNHISGLVEGTNEILKLQTGLHEHANYHLFCRLLGRLKTNVQLTELVSAPKYSEWVRNTAELTVKSLQSWQWACGSVFYLLTLWSRLVNSVHYLKGDVPSHLDSVVPGITDAYIQSRLDSVTTSVQANEDPLEDKEDLSDQLDALPLLCRFQYEHTLNHLVTLLDPLLTAFGEMSQMQPGSDTSRISVVEGQLAWLVYIVGAVIRGRLQSSASEQHEIADGELSCRLFRLVQVMDSGFHSTRYASKSRQKLDLACLNFMQGFRKVYIGEQIMHSSKVFDQLSENLGLSDHLMVLDVTAAKVLANLRMYVECDEVVEASLDLLQELASGYMSGKLLLKVESVRSLLVNHNQDQFPFLSRMSNSRSRTIFYHTLSRLICMEESPTRFISFLKPLDSILSSLDHYSLHTSHGLQSVQTRYAIIGVFRDLRGVVQATQTRKTYGLLFDWFYPRHCGFVLRVIDQLADDPEVVVPVLKFLSELAHNKTQRMSFEVSSAKGVLLFRELSKCITSYSRYNVSISGGNDPYRNKHKAMWVCFQILSRALGGNYVCFGVFDLYGDPALRDALNSVLNMATQVNFLDLSRYRKAEKAYHALIEVICSSQLRFLSTCDTSTFSFVMHSLENGIRSHDADVSSQSASSTDSLVSFYFQHLPDEHDPAIHDSAAASLASHLSSMQGVLAAMLNTLLEIVLFEECRNQWSLSRAMLPLILVNLNQFHTIKQSLVESQPSERKEQVQACFSKLMSDISISLDTKNRDRFTQALSVFRHEFTSKRS